MVQLFHIAETSIGVISFNFSHSGEFISLWFFYLLIFPKLFEWNWHFQKIQIDYSGILHTTSKKPRISEAYPSILQVWHQGLAFLEDNCIHSVQLLPHQRFKSSNWLIKGNSIEKSNFREGEFGKARYFLMCAINVLGF